MANWLEHTVLPAAIAAALLLLVLWPTERSGFRLLQTWGIEQPRPDQVTEAVRYLRQRRILYVILFLAVPSLAGTVLEDDSELPGMNIFVPLLVAMLLAELLATLRPVGGVRVASLDRRTWRDLVPRWAVWTMATLVGLTVVPAVLCLTAEPVVAGENSGAAWTALAYLAASLVMTGLLVWLAVRRPSVTDEAVDAALRTRTARVAFGIGFGWVGSALNIVVQRIYSLYSSSSRPGAPAPPSWLTDGVAKVAQFGGLVVLAVVIVCWLWVALPTRRSLDMNRR